MDEKVTVKLVRYEDEIKQEVKRSMRPIMIIILIIGLIVGGSSVYFLGGSKSSSSVSQSKGNFNEVYDIMTSEWYFGSDIDQIEEVMMNNAIVGMVNESGDPYTNYITPENAKDFMEAMSGSYEGIGVSYRLESGSFRILRVFTGSPAEAAGLRAGDVIIAVDGKDVTGMDQTELAKLVKGEKGSEVVIRVRRGSEELDFTAIRASIDHSTNAEIRNEDGSKVGYLEITQFAEKTAEEMKQHLTHFETEGVEYLVIDLRGNPGGYLTTVQAVLDLLLPKDEVILQVKDIHGTIETYKTKSGVQFEFKDVVLLTDEHSASASEVMAAAMSEISNTTIVGKNTFGKGTVQTSIPFADGAILKYTFAEWLTPSGKPLNKIGVAPTVEVESLFSNISVIELTETLRYDSVSAEVAKMQKILRLEGLETGREDGYFNQQTKEALETFQAGASIPVTGELDSTSGSALMDALYRRVDDKQYDLQYQAALKELGK